MNCAVLSISSAALVNVRFKLDNSLINDFNLSCNKMIIYYKGNTGNMLLADHNNDSQGTSIKKIDFFKDVMISRDGKVARGDIGAFDPKVNLITLIGNVSLKESSNYIEGEKATYNTKTGVFKIAGSENKKNNRVQILISDSNDKNELQNKLNENKQ